MRNNIAFYLRLSRSDGDLGEDNKDESNSIENQRLLLHSYVDAHEELLGEITEYVDDGYTGTNFDRPGFKQMFEDARAKKIDVILVKDLSRLGRDYIEVGDYLEQIFPVIGVRVIAVNNNYDSDDYIGSTAGMDVAVTNIINSLYSRDISKKRKSADKVRWQQGYITNGACSYGYMRDPKQKGKYIPNPETAPVVKEIFDMACKGMICSQIAKELNARGITPPGVLKSRIQIRYVVPEEERLWDYQSVYYIVKNYKYTGALVAGEHSKVSFGLKAVRKVSEDKVTIVENANEPIVSKEVYEQAQLIFRNVSQKTFKAPYDYPLKGKCRCGNCGAALYYYCGQYGATVYCGASRSKGKKSKCCKDSYELSVINAQVKYAIGNMLQKTGYINQLIKQQKAEDGSAVSFSHPDIKESKSKLEILQADVIRKYETYADGHITVAQFMEEKKRLSEKIEGLKDYISKMEQLVEESTKASKDLDSLCEEGTDVMSEVELTQDMVDAFVENVYIHDREHIEIVFKGDDVIKAALDSYVEKLPKAANA